MPGKNHFLIILLIFFYISATAADDCILGTLLSETSGYCSNAGQYNNQNSENKAWFQFVAIATDVTIGVKGKGMGGTLANPSLKLYADCQGTLLVGSESNSENSISYYKGGLVIGKTYYFSVSGSGSQTGTFQLCLNNYTPLTGAGHDCSTAAYICSTQTVFQHQVTGAGLNNNEAAGTCLDVPGQASESNSTWYKWQAANSGILVFTITPNDPLDDIDWVLYDMGPSDNCNQVNAVNAIRCKAGYGVSNTDCPGDAIYYKTGLDFNDIDLTEPPGCGKGQNGKLRFVNQVAGHYYALLINNFSSGNKGFTLAFTDQLNQPGTALFKGPEPHITFTGVNDCTTDQTYTFSGIASDYESLSWTFGEDATITTGNTTGPYIVRYTTPGIKTITLTAVAKGGCTVLTTQHIVVGFSPAKPVVNLNKQVYCLNDTVKLSSTIYPGATYEWTGPNNFTSWDNKVSILMSSESVSGTYYLRIKYNACESDFGSVNVPAPLPAPVAGFSTTPSSLVAEYGPLKVTFNNNSTGADYYLWNFGDGGTSTDVNPEHEYILKGEYDVQLTAFKTNSCTSVSAKGKLIVIQNDNYLFIPNIFSPNGDGVNDEFKVTITNIQNYHLLIYNRWGEKLFESNNISESWNGMYKGVQVPFGAYYYKITALSYNGKLLSRAGSITLVR
jgi:gliding motility-associated-like protein